MGTSYIEYAGFGFWSRDSFISDWLDVLLKELRAFPTHQPWQSSLIEHWQNQMEIDGGMMSLDLDEFLNEQARRDIVLSAAKNALYRARPDALRTGELFIDLLDGKLKTTVSSPINYLE